MGEPITVPLWLFVAIAVFALWSLLDRLLIPSGRWFVRRRLNRLIDRVNQKLAVEIKPFQLTKRQVLIDRLVYDPQVRGRRQRACPRATTCRAKWRWSRSAATRARSCRPSTPTSISGSATAIARAVARFLYRVRLGFADERSAGRRDRRTPTVVFVMNHRSNMDYVLVAFLAAERTALSYAVGEWARIWPLQQLDPLDGRLLRAPQLQQTRSTAGCSSATSTWRPRRASPRRCIPRAACRATAGCASPSSACSTTCCKSFDPARERDIVFVPVGAQLRPRARGSHAAPLARPRDAAGAAPGSPPARRSRFWLGPARPDAARPLVPLRLRLRQLRRPDLGARLAGQHAGMAGGDLRGLDKEQRFEIVGRLARDVMDEIARLVPVLPVSLIATVLLRSRAAARRARAQGARLAS